MTDTVNQLCGLYITRPLALWENGIEDSNGCVRVIADMNKSIHELEGSARQGP